MMHSKICHFNYDQVALIIKATIIKPSYMDFVFRDIGELTVCKIKARKRILQAARDIVNGKIR